MEIFIRKDFVARTPLFNNNPHRVVGKAGITSSFGFNKSSRSGPRGQELVEFAVMLPLLLIILIGVIDLGRVFHASITIANATRTGARYATSYGFESIGGGISMDHAAIGARAQTEAQNSGLILDTVSVNCPGGCVHGGPVVVTATHNFTFLFNAFIGSGLTLNHSVEMRIPW